MDSYSKSIRLNPEELSHIEAAAKKANMSFSSYVRAVALGHQVVDRSFTTDIVRHMCELRPLIDSIDNETQREKISIWSDELWQCLKSAE